MSCKKTKKNNKVLALVYPGRKCHVGFPVGPKNLELGASKIKTGRQCKIMMFFYLEMVLTLN